MASIAAKPQFYHTPKPPRRLPERKAVTFILGMKCKDGMVLCSDSLEADGVTKKNVQKLFKYEKPGEWGIAFGCSGTTAACSNFGDRLLEQMQSEQSFSRRAMEKTIEAHVHYMAQEYPKESLDIVLGLYGPNASELKLYKAQTTTQCLSIHSDYVCGGMDISLGRFLLDSLYDDRVTVNDGVYIASFVTHVMKEKADGVGGPTQLMVFAQSHPHWFSLDNKTVAKIEEGGFIGGAFSFAGLEKSVRQFCWSRFPHEFRPERESS